MICFTTEIKKFAAQGEKTGWTYIEIPADIAQQIKPNTKKSFLVKGSIDNHTIEQVSLLPMGEGNFIIPLNTAIRRKIQKPIGAILNVSLTEDTKPFEINNAFIECLQDEPAALATFTKLPFSHQKYFSKWIDSAKAQSTKAKRIAMAVTALSHGKGYAEMIRSNQDKKNL